MSQATFFTVQFLCQISWKIWKLSAVFMSNDVTYTPLKVGIGIGLDKSIDWSNTSLLVGFWSLVWDWRTVWVTLLVSNGSRNKNWAITTLSLWRSFYSDMFFKIWNEKNIVFVIYTNSCKKYSRKRIKMEQRFTQNKLFNKSFI